MFNDTFYSGCNLPEVVVFLYSVSLLMQLAVLAGDFLLSRACVALASLKNTEVMQVGDIL